MTDSIFRHLRLESLVGDDIGTKILASTSTSTYSIELDDEQLTGYVNGSSSMNFKLKILWIHVLQLHHM